MHIDEWPNCSTPDCEHKVCLWSGTSLCSRCWVHTIGPEEYLRRYAETHGMTMQEALEGDKTNA